MSSLWSPASRRLSIHSIPVNDLNGDQILISGRGNVFRVLCEQWAATFDTANVSRIVGDAFLCQWGRRTDVADVTPPTVQLYLQAMAGARHSAPGPDGLLAAAWQASPRLSAAVISFFYDEVRFGHSLPVWANEMLQVFSPRGSVDGDSVSVVRTATSA